MTAGAVPLVDLAGFAAVGEQAPRAHFVQLQGLLATSTV
jgi:hypothetical protein